MCNLILGVDPHRSFDLPTNCILCFSLLFLLIKAVKLWHVRPRLITCTYNHQQTHVKPAHWTDPMVIVTDSATLMSHQTLMSPSLLPLYSMSSLPSTSDLMPEVVESSVDIPSELVTVMTLLSTESEEVLKWQTKPKTKGRRHYYGYWQPDHCIQPAYNTEYYKYFNNMNRYKMFLCSMIL